jgi:hypothetical protein
MVRRLVCLSMGLLIALAGSASAFAADNCDRACLKTALDQYLKAVTTHNPSAAPLFAGFRQTENAIVVKLGNGIWKTATGLGKVQRQYLDAVSGQAAFYGVIEEGTSSAVATVRIRVEDKKITEAEWFLARVGDPGLNGPTPPGATPGNLFNPDGLAALPPREGAVPKDKRLSRELLLAITNSYFDGLTTHDGTIIMAHPGCTRIENGTNMSAPRGGGGRGAAAGAGGAQARGGQTPAAPAATSDCTSGLANLNVQNVAARRFPVVDEEANVVLAMAVFIRKPGSPTPRNAFSEWFFIDEGKIRTIYTAMFYPTPEIPVPNWPPFEGNWPLPAGIVPTPAAPR